ncbi:thiosulfate/3-mercaptopyruvate sulfurtransferase [Rhodoligotrophos appendicifer]|uniref:3-mercaptopyruvate sulfurtransferase n=1 Tax=Rhodoligotrophos appendicifer TaxID=987056 RepID=UPI001186FA5A|nr:3-mercaptopyruvate sulfurtransferase [Rhodoligotrophos appendicifer]
MSETDNANLVSTGWLATHLSAPDVVVMDASWYLPADNRDPRAEYLEEHIPGALFFDLDAISDTDSNLPHMLPSPEKFASIMRRMGVGDGHRVIVYDTKGLFAAARAWWMFRVFGHRDVSVLDGGFPKWKAEGRPIEDMSPPPRQERHFTARLNTLLVRDKGEVEGAVQDKSYQLADARSAGRFTGSEKEPRPGLRSGHIPGARNVHYATLLNEDGTLKSPEAIRRAFEAAGIDIAKPIITTCGSGVTAAILSLGLTLIGHPENALYDGSWVEWGSDQALPVATGAN